MRKIKLTQNKVALVDNADYDYLNQWKWCASYSGSIFYALRAVRPSGFSSSGERRRNLYMHRVILGLKFGDRKQIDHIDGNGLNNQRSNLRFCSQLQNNQNRRKRQTGAISDYKGVNKCPNSPNWNAHIRFNGKKRHLGCFELEKDAAVAYNKAALKYFREFARPNIL